MAKKVIKKVANNNVLSKSELRELLTLCRTALSEHKQARLQLRDGLIDIVNFADDTNWRAGIVKLLLAACARAERSDDGLFDTVRQVFETLDERVPKCEPTAKSAKK